MRSKGFWTHSSQRSSREPHLELTLEFPRLLKLDGLPKGPVKQDGKHKWEEMIYEAFEALIIWFRQGNNSNSVQTRDEMAQVGWQVSLADKIFWHVFICSSIKDSFNNLEILRHWSLGFYQGCKFYANIIIFTNKIKQFFYHYRFQYLIFIVQNCAKMMLGNVCQR